VGGKLEHGASVIVSWSWGLVRAASAFLLDWQTDAALAHGVRKGLEKTGDRESDLHLWRVGPGHAAAVISIVSYHPEPADHYKSRLADLMSLSHVTIDVLHCRPA
jgi:Co/Zn/Cd efflux system component